VKQIIVLTLLIALFGLIATLDVYAGLLEGLNPNSQVSGEAEMRNGAHACYMEILRKVGQAKVNIMGPCKVEKSIGGIRQLSNGYEMTFSVKNQYDTSGMLFPKQDGIIVTCQTNQSGQLINIAERSVKKVYEGAFSGLCMGQPQLF
jgi:hypothetical protein